MAAVAGLVPWAESGTMILVRLLVAAVRRDTALMSSTPGELAVGAGGGLEGHARPCR